MACLRLFFSRTSRCTGDLTHTAPNLTRRRLKRSKCCSEKGQSTVLQLLLLTFAREIPLKNCQFRVGTTSSGLYYNKLFLLILVCRWECISSDSSNLLLSLIRPKLVLSGWNHHKTQNSLLWHWLSSNIPGHTHHGCNTTHGQGIFYFHCQDFFYFHGQGIFYFHGQVFFYFHEQGIF